MTGAGRSSCFVDRQQRSQQIDVFDLRQRLVDDCADYTRSSVNISDPRIEAHVEQELKDGLLWPHPSVQLNTAFESGGHMTDAVIAAHRRRPRLRDEIYFEGIKRRTK